MTHEEIALDIELVYLSLIDCDDRHSDCSGRIRYFYSEQEDTRYREREIGLAVAFISFIRSLGTREKCRSVRTYNTISVFREVETAIWLVIKVCHPKKEKCCPKPEILMVYYLDKVLHRTYEIFALLYGRIGKYLSSGHSEDLQYKLSGFLDRYTQRQIVQYLSHLDLGVLTEAERFYDNPPLEVVLSAQRIFEEIKSTVHPGVLCHLRYNDHTIRNEIDNSLLPLLLDIFKWEQLLQDRSTGAESHKLVKKKDGWVYRDIAANLTLTELFCQQQGADDRRLFAYCFRQDKLTLISLAPSTLSEDELNSLGQSLESIISVDKDFIVSDIERYIYSSRCETVDPTANIEIFFHYSPRENQYRLCYNNNNHRDAVFAMLSIFCEENSKGTPSYNDLLIKNEGLGQFMSRKFPTGQTIIFCGRKQCTAADMREAMDLCCNNENIHSLPMQ